MTVFSVRHKTVFYYARPVSFGEHRLLFRPRDSYDQRLLTSTLDIDPAPSDIRWMHDVFGNCVALVTFDTPAKRAMSLMVGRRRGASDISSRARGAFFIRSLGLFRA